MLRRVAGLVLAITLGAGFAGAQSVWVAPTAPSTSLPPLQAAPEIPDEFPPAQGLEPGVEPAARLDAELPKDSLASPSLAPAQPFRAVPVSPRTLERPVARVVTLPIVRGVAAANEPPNTLGSLFEPAKDDPTADPNAATKRHLDGLFDQAQRALEVEPADLGAAMAAMETIEWSSPYFPVDAYRSWTSERSSALTSIEEGLEKAIEKRIRAEIAEGDFSSAREMIDELERQHPAWTKERAALLAELKAALPAEDAKHDPFVSASGPDGMAELVDRYLSGGKYRQAEYVLTTLEKRETDWVAQNDERVAAWKDALLQGIYSSFEKKKVGYSPVEAKRLAEYAQALTDGSNRGFGFKHPAKQDPESRMCTIMSICNAIDASIGFSDKSMDIEGFTKVVREILGDPTLGDTKGLSTYRVRKLLKELGLPLKVVEMQDRLKRPFEEKELLKLFRPDQVVIPVFIIAQHYADEGLVREEHKGFLRDAYFSATENRWIYLMADPLIGRISFYSWNELQPFLHKLFIIRVEKSLTTPSK